MKQRQTALATLKIFATMFAGGHIPSSRRYRDSSNHDFLYEHHKRLFGKAYADRRRAKKQMNQLT